MNIRESVRSDHTSIAQLHRAAFGEPEGATIAELAIALLNDPTAQPVLSLVAEDADELTGHVLFSRITVDGEDIGGCIMAPLAVASAYQKRGIGKELIQRGLAMLRERGTNIVLVLGDPGYYNRAGFDAGHSLKPPYELRYPEAWMALELHAGALAHAAGTVRCADSLNNPGHW